MRIRNSQFKFLEFIIFNIRYLFLYVHVGKFFLFLFPPYKQFVTRNPAKDAQLEEAEAEKKKAEEEKHLGAFRANWKTWGATAWFITLVRDFVTLVREFQTRLPSLEG